MTPYTYAAPDGTREVHHFRMGEAPRVLAGGYTRVYDASLQFTYGKDQFHGATIKERTDRQMAECAADGRKIEPVGSRWV